MLGWIKSTAIKNNTFQAKHVQNINENIGEERLCVGGYANQTN